MGKQATNTGRNWYAIHTYSGYEDAVAEALQQRIDSMNMQEYIFDVVVPKESQVVLKGGEKVIEKKKIFPGYVLVDMVVTDDSWYVVRNTPNVTGFVGAGNIPVPVSAEEFRVIQRRAGEEATSFKIDFEVGDTVTIIDGPFTNYESMIQNVNRDQGKVKVFINMFGRDTPIELDFTQVKKKV